MPKPSSQPLPRKTTIQAVRTRKANNCVAAKQAKSSTLSVANKRLAALELRIQNYSIADIGMAIGVSPGRVSQLLAESLDEKRKATVQATEVLRVLELERVDKMILAWFERAKADARASTVLLGWLARRHRLLGLDWPIGESAVREGQNRPNEASCDLSRLSDEELMLLEEIMTKAMGK